MMLPQEVDPVSEAERLLAAKREAGPLGPLPDYEKDGRRYCCHCELMLAIDVAQMDNTVDGLVSRVTKLEGEIAHLRRLLRTMATWQELAQRIVTDWEPRRMSRMPYRAPESTQRPSQAESRPQGQVEPGAEAEAGTPRPGERSGLW